MGINTKCIAKFEEAYKDIPETIIPFEFVPTSPYYHMEEWREVLPMFVPGVVPHTYWISNHGRVYTNLRSPNYPNGGIINEWRLPYNSKPDDVTIETELDLVRRKEVMYDVIVK